MDRFSAEGGGMMEARDDNGGGWIIVVPEFFRVFLDSRFRGLTLTEISQDLMSNNIVPYQMI